MVAVCRSVLHGREIEREDGEEVNPNCKRELGNATKREGRMVAQSTQMMEIIVQEMEEGMEETRRRGRL